jgi:hypothetical protein
MFGALAIVFATGCTATDLKKDDMLYPCFLEMHSGVVYLCISLVQCGFFLVMKFHAFCTDDAHMAALKTKTILWDSSGRRV